MKSLLNDDDENCNNYQKNNLLGFSSSSSSSSSVHNNDHNNHSQFYNQQNQNPSSVSSSVSTTSFYLSPSQLNPSGFSYNNSAFVHHAPLSMMPLKSDGSLCIMEALTRSQTQVMMPSSSPKLEDFLGGATMGAHDEYSGNQREAMALSLDSMYYSSNQNSEPQNNNRGNSSSSSSSLELLLLSDPFSQQQQNHHHHHHVNAFYSGLGCNNAIFQGPIGEESKEDQGIANCFKNFVATREFSSSSCSVIAQQSNLEQNVNGSSNNINNNTNYSNNAKNGSVHHCGSVSIGVGNLSGCGDLQSLSLSMSPGSQSSCVTVPSNQISIPSCNKDHSSTMAIEAKKRGSAKLGLNKQTVHRKSIDTFGQRTSQYRGVTRHRWTGRYEAHLWDNSCKKEGQTRKGRQVYLGGYDMEEKAARAYDLAALKYWGASTHINFPLENYLKELEEMKNLSRQEYVAHLRRKSSGFSRGASMYRGVTRHHQHGRWQARIGRVAGNKDLYLGTFSTQEEAAEAYDVAAIKFRGVNAVTNFDISRYDVEKIMASNTLLSGEMARRNNNNNNINTNTNKPRTEPISQIITNREEQIVESSNNNNNEIGSSDWRNYSRNSGFSTSGALLHDLIGIDSVVVGSSNSTTTTMILDESTKLGSDKKMGPTLLFPKENHDQMVIPKMISSNSTSTSASADVSSSNWFTSTRSTPMSHMPVFAAWNDI